MVATHASGARVLIVAISPTFPQPTRLTLTVLEWLGRGTRWRSRQALAFAGLTMPPSGLILYHMVNYHDRLDRTFAALADPTRRAILARLESEDAASVSDLAKPFAIKLPAVMKHLAVLDEAGLITRSKVGRTVTVRLSPIPIREAMNWLRRYERFWSSSLDRLAAYAEDQEVEARKKDR